MSVIVSAPSAPGLAVMPLVWNTDWPVSVSVMVSWPVAMRSGLVASSVTAPALTPVMTGRSLVPVMLTVTLEGVPSAEVTLKVSV